MEWIILHMHKNAPTYSQMRTKNKRKKLDAHIDTHNDGIAHTYQNAHTNRVARR